MNIYLQVALPVPLYQTFTYLYEDLSGSLEDTNSVINLVGHRVLVQFGRGKKKREITGLVFSQSFSDSNSVGTNSIKKIIEIIDEEAIFSENMLQFLQWISSYYIAPIGEVVKAALPNGISPKTIHKFSLNHEMADFSIQHFEKTSIAKYKLLKYLRINSSAVTIEHLEKQCEIPNIKYHVQHLLDNNYIFLDSLVETKIKPKVQRAVKIPQDIFIDKQRLQETMNSLDKRAYKQSQVLAIVSAEQRRTDNPVLITTINKIINQHALNSNSNNNLNLDSNSNSTATASITSLINKKILEICEVEINRNIDDSTENKLSIKNEAFLKLTEEQQICLGHIEKSILNNNYKAFLLHGVTGSGKTLVYIQAISVALKANKTVLLLVPEISLTPQLVDRFKNVFSDLVTVFHSKMSDAQRYDSWRLVLAGKASIVIGARSALFAPLKNLGLIIVDEEHESSYKQTNQVPYYQARDAAMYRAMLENATVVLGSATPSLETFYNTQIKKIELLSISSRADGASLPKIQIIDMISASRNSQVMNNFSHELIRKIKEKLEKKEGVILFQNKRGFATYLECDDCGDIQQCPNCSVSLTYHQASKELRCHYCGYIKKSSNICQVCGKTGLMSIGVGTQRIEEDLSNILLSENIVASISRLDLDTTNRRGAHREILYNFSVGKSDILIGTQMVAKGLDFHRVALVGVINADIQLNLPDFRAAERTFQLLSQVSGRAGRSEEIKGEVIIQTRQAENYAVSTVINSDFKKFYDIEIKKREETLFPPFVRYCIVEFSSSDESKIIFHAHEFYNMLPKHNSLIFFPPISAMVYRLNKKYRCLISIKSIKSLDSSGKYLRKALKIALDKYNKELSSSSVNIRVDIDAYSIF